MKDIPNFEGKYAITEDGRVWSYKFKRFIKPKVVNRYRLVDLCRSDGSKWQAAVHRLVAMTYIPNPNNYPVVNHKDEDRLNNHVENLEWCTQKYNVNYRGAPERRKANRGSLQSCWDAAREVRSKAVRCIETGKVYKSSAEAARLLGVKANGIARCCRGEHKTAYGYHWAFTNNKEVSAHG